MGLIKRKAKRTAKRAASKATVKCRTCGKRYSNPLTHTCTVRTDYKRRHAAEQRRQKREAAKARRKAAAGRRKAAAADRRQKARGGAGPRPSQPKHDYRLCRDEECTRHACVAFREGIEACPLPHGDG